METEHSSSGVLMQNELPIEKYGNINEDKIDIKYYIDNFNGTTRFTYKKIDKSDPTNEKCFEFVDFFDISPDDFIKSGIIDFVVSGIEKNEKIVDSTKNDSKINSIFDKLSITVEEEKIYEINNDNDINKSNISNVNSFKKLRNIPKITITNEKNEIKNCTTNNDKTNPICLNDKTIEYSSALANNIYNDAFNINTNISTNNSNVNILHKYSDLKEVPLSLYNNENINEAHYNNIKKDYSVPMNYDYQTNINNNIFMTNKKLKETNDSINNVEDKQKDRNIFLEKEKSSDYNYDTNNYNNLEQSEYTFDENYAKAMIRQHESFKDKKIFLPDEDKIKTVITLKDDGFSDILNVNHCIECILERTLQANPFYHAQPDRLSMRCSKCKPCSRHFQNDIDGNYKTKEETLNNKNHECVCQDICREIICPICEKKIPLCKNLEHEKDCIDKYSAPVEMPQISKSENNIKFLRSDSHEMIKLTNEKLNNTTFDKERQKKLY